MFNLESSIATWRQQMLAAGIQSPTPLDELESHLREEVTRQIQAGASDEKAIEIATAQMGQPDCLKSEFKKTARFVDRLTPQRRTLRILGLLWLVKCVFGLFAISTMIGFFLNTNHVEMQVFGSLIKQENFIILLILLQGLTIIPITVASLRLIADNGGKSVILFFAIWSLVTFVATMNVYVGLVSIMHWLTWFKILCSPALNIITIWLLWPRKTVKPVTY